MVIYCFYYHFQYHNLSSQVNSASQRAICSSSSVISRLQNSVTLTAPSEWLKHKSRDLASGKSLIHVRSLLIISQIHIDGIFELLFHV